jgi:hypothetical protein
MGLSPVINPTPSNEALPLALFFSTGYILPPFILLDPVVSLPLFVPYLTRSRFGRWWRGHERWPDQATMPLRWSLPSLQRRRDPSSGRPSPPSGVALSVSVPLWRLGPTPLHLPTAVGSSPIPCPAVLALTQRGARLSEAWRPARLALSRRCTKHLGATAVSNFPRRLEASSLSWGGWHGGVSRLTVGEWGLPVLVSGAAPSPPR